MLKFVHYENIDFYFSIYKNNFIFSKYLQRKTFQFSKDQNKIKNQSKIKTTQYNFIYKWKERDFIYIVAGVTWC